MIIYLVFIHFKFIDQFDKNLERKYPELVDRNKDYLKAFILGGVVLYNRFMNCEHYKKFTYDFKRFNNLSGIDFCFQNLYKLKVL
jgi:hypothetical protein